MDRLPTKLGRQVCGLLDLEEIQSLRSVSKHYNNLATPFLIHQLQLVFHPESFDRLLAVARHPVISKQINSLHYGFALFKEYKSQDDWKKLIRSNTNHRTRKVNADYKAKQLDMEYAGSKEMLESQTCMKSFHYGKKQLEEAIPSMPNLQHLTVTICDALTPASIHRFSFRAFYSGSPMPFDDIANGHAHRVPQLRAFYRAAFKHVLKLKSFACKGISWQLFKSAKKDLVKLAIVLLEADSMVLHLSASYGHGTGPETKHCQQYLKNGKVSDPLRQMEHLQNLELHMDQRPILAWELRHVVGSSTWGRLTRISLAYMEATEEDLVHFIERHARTLRNLYLSAIRFTHGKWITAFEWMQVCLNHKINVLVEGRLISQDPREAFFLGYRELEGMLVRSDRPCLNKRQRLANWFKDGGECPLVEC